MNGVRSCVEEFRRSLKHPEAEEILDLFLYRPLSYVLVKSVRRLPVTPNQISFLSLAAGLLSAYYISLGESGHYRYGAFLLLAANLLDCMDGQLARLQGKGTFLGRIVDGVADYITGTALFVALALALEGERDYAWLLSAAAGVSTMIQAMAFDNNQGEFIKYRTGKGNLTSDDIRGRFENRSGVEGGKLSMGSRFLAGLYLVYLKLQKKSRIIFPGFVNKPDSSYNLLTLNMRLWSFLGISTNRSLLIIFCFLGLPEYYLYAVILCGNLWLGICFMVQYFISSR